jgi:tetratricopeptide (TPR) repeat protein
MIFDSPPLQFHADQVPALEFAQYGSVLLSQADTPASLYSSALGYFQSGNINRAIQVWTKLIYQNNLKEQSLYNRAQAYLVIRQLPLANSDLDLLLSSQLSVVSRSSVLLLRGIVFSEQGNLAAALQDLNASLALEPSSNGLSNRAVIYLKQKQYKLAESDLRQAIKSDPSQSNLYNLASVQLSLGSFKECVASTNKLVAMNKFFPMVYTLRGTCLYRLRNYDEAISEFRRATSLDPQQADALYYQGLSLLALNKKDSALALILRSADMYLAVGNTPMYQEAMKTLSTIQ